MNKKAKVGLTIFGIIMVLFIVLMISLSYSSVNHITITIKDKERIQDGSSSKYLIFTPNEVFENTDSILFMKFDSSDVYNNLDVGKTYNVKVNWYRIPFFSSYRNLLEIEQ